MPLWQLKARSFTTTQMATLRAGYGTAPPTPPLLPARRSRYSSGTAQKSSQLAPVTATYPRKHGTNEYLNNDAVGWSIGHFRGAGEFDRFCLTARVALLTFSACRLLQVNKSD